MKEKQAKLMEQLKEESQYLKKIKKELNEEKQHEKTVKLKKAEEAARIFESNAVADRIKEQRRQAEHKEDIRLAEYRQKQEEEQEARREAEVNARAAKI